MAVSLWCAEKTGWVRNSDRRTSPAGSASGVDTSMPSTSDPSTPKADQTAVRWSRRVTSSQATPTWSASTRRRLTPSPTAAATTSSARPGTRVSTVSKYPRCTTCTPPGDPAQPLRPVVDGVRASHHREQDLRGADVAGRLLPADVLLPGLQREPVRRPPVRVPGDADQPPRQLPLEPGAHRHEAGVRTAEAERHAEALRRADHHVGTPLARWLEQRQGEQVGADRHHGAARLRFGDDPGQVPDRAGPARVLQQQAG